MGFDQFLGNRGSVRHLREAIAGGRMPPALILAGPRGAGKYTLAIMLAQAMACRSARSRTVCPISAACAATVPGSRSPCPWRAREEAVAAREELRETDKKDTRILIQTHPDLLVIPPDPPQLLIKIGQVRGVIQRLYRLPADAPRALYIFTSAAFMKEAANSLLKVLEEPPDTRTFCCWRRIPASFCRRSVRDRALSPGRTAPGGDRSRARRTAQRLEPSHRALVARLAEGAIGQALGFDLEGYLASRQDALVFLHNAIGDGAGDTDFATLFRVTETYRAGAEGQEKPAGLLHFRSLLEDLLLLRGSRAFNPQYRPYG